MRLSSFNQTYYFSAIPKTPMHFGTIDYINPPQGRTYKTFQRQFSNDKGKRFAMSHAQTGLSNYFELNAHLIKQLDSSRSISVEVLGGADGGQALALALEFKKQNKLYTMTSIDYNPALTKIAQAGLIYLMKFDIERLKTFYNGLTSKIFYKLPTVHSKRTILRRILAEHDISIEDFRPPESKLYSVINPGITYIKDDILDYLKKQPVSPHNEQKIYAISDVLGYFINYREFDKIPKIFETILEKNPDNTIYLIFGKNHDRYLFNDGKFYNLALEKRDFVGGGPDEKAKQFNLGTLLTALGFENLHFKISHFGTLDMGDHVLWVRRAKS